MLPLRMGRGWCAKLRSVAFGAATKPFSVPNGPGGSGTSPGRRPGTVPSRSRSAGAWRCVPTGKTTSSGRSTTMVGGLVAGSSTPSTHERGIRSAAPIVGVTTSSSARTSRRQRHADSTYSATPSVARADPNTCTSSSGRHHTSTTARDTIQPTATTTANLRRRRSLMETCRWSCPSSTSTSLRLAPTVRRKEAARHDEAVRMATCRAAVRPAVRSPRANGRIAGADDHQRTNTWTGTSVHNACESSGMRAVASVPSSRAAAEVHSEQRPRRTGGQRRTRRRAHRPQQHHADE